MKLTVSYANHLISLIRDKGEFSLKDLNLGIDEAILENESNLLDFSQVTPLIKKVIELYNDQCAGLYVGHSQTLSSWGIAGFAIMTRRTLYDAIALGLKYYKATPMLLKFNCNHIKNGTSKLSIKSHDTEQAEFAFCFESTIASLLSIYQQLTGKSINIISIDLSYHLNNAKKKEYEHHFDCSVTTGHDNTVIHFEIPQNENLNLYDVANSNMFLQQLTDRHEGLKSNCLVSRINTIISKGNGKFYSQTEMAKELNISTSLLAKRLLESKVSYRELLEAAKKKVALKHLKASHNMKMYEVAILSGYSDLSNFRKAFLRWEGMTPSDYRKMHQL